MAAQGGIWDDHALVLHGGQDERLQLWEEGEAFALPAAAKAANGWRIKALRHLQSKLQYGTVADLLLTLRVYIAPFLDEPDSFCLRTLIAPFAIGMPVRRLMDACHGCCLEHHSRACAECALSCGMSFPYACRTLRAMAEPSGVCDMQHYNWGVLSCILLLLKALWRGLWWQSLPVISRKALQAWLSDGVLWRSTTAGTC